MYVGPTNNASKLSNDVQANGVGKCQGPQLTALKRGIATWGLVATVSKCCFWVWLAKECRHLADEVG